MEREAGAVCIACMGARGARWVGWVLCVRVKHPAARERASPMGQVMPAVSSIRKRTNQAR